MRAEGAYHNCKNDNKNTNIVHWRKSRMSLRWLPESGDMPFADTQKGSSYPAVACCSASLSGHTTSWTLFNIATVPGVQDKIAEELDSLGLLAKPGCPPPRELEWEDLKKLPYLTAATKEAMRMLPVVSVMGRVAGKDMMCGPYKIPKGTFVATPLFAIHNTIHNWQEPQEYRPERWLDVPVETYVYDSTTTTTGGEGAHGMMWDGG